MTTVVVSAVVSTDLPEQMAIHFRTGGDPDSFVARPLAVASLPALAVGLSALFEVLPGLDPLARTSPSSRPATTSSWSSPPPFWPACRG